MVSENRGSELEDPLAAYSGLSLFPRTLSSLPNPPKLEDLHDAHNFLKSMPLGCSKSLQEQAKFIIDRSSELLSSKMPSSVTFENKDESIIVATGLENNRERRLGLGRERARFSLKPNSSQPTVSLEPTLDIANLKDPEEFFSAFERLDNAKKELQRQKGTVLTEIDQNKLFTVAPRPRREGISGRTVKYKHRYSVSVSSQDTFEEDNSSPWEQSSQQEMINRNLESEERELNGSITTTENKVNELLDELLSDSCEELDGDRAISLLREHLQIKPIDLEKLDLPDFEDIHRIDLKGSGGKPKRPRNSLSDIHSLLPGIRTSNTPLKQKNAESSASPSPLASISLLKKRILQSKSSTDPFAAQDIDHFPVRNASPVKSINQQSEQVDFEKQISAFKELRSSMIGGNDTEVANISLPEVANTDLNGLSDKSVNDNSSRLCCGVGASGSYSGIKDNTKDTGVDHGVVNEDLSMPDADSDVRRGGPNGLDDMMGDLQQEGLSSAQPDIINMEDSAVEPTNGINSHMVNQSSPAATEDHAMDGCSNTNTVDSVPEQHNQKVKESSKQRKGTSRPSREHKSKGQSRRQSLAASGTSWTDGVRRSTRIKSRPLEYWKGERFLYGRIHQSLPTVIGIKYESPAKDDQKPSFKVKSYVSDDYKELVDLAALH